MRNLRLCSITISWVLLCWTHSVFAQDLEPRRWAQIPTGVNFAGIGYGYVNGDIFLDPLLLAEDVTLDMHNVAAFYMRSFGFLGKSARVDFSVPYQMGKWEGLLDDVPTRLERNGIGDARMRFSMLLYGGPAQAPKEFSQAPQSNTVIGAAVAVTVPTGEYSVNRLINLGANRWVIRPQLGVTHNRGKWTGELTGSTFVYSDNNEFFKGVKQETEPLFALQAHVIYTFKPGLWASLSSGYGWGGESTVNGVHKHNPTGNWLTALSLGLPVNRKQGVKLSLLTGRSQRLTGADIDSVVMAYSIMF